uniref:Ribonuclease H-like domain-containing protein n=1 Tax=Tanacetum cinerariifolium TaxID=118510 RepID=A0A6L2NI32_TANCI|nr:ribonuclease H-like domain-containing protein [Tanacetum cinerariifolium]
MRKSMLKQEFLEFRIREEEGFHKGYDRMQKILSQHNQLKAKPDAEDINLKFLRALPSSWSQVALTLKIKGGLEFLSFDDLYYKLKTLAADVKGYSTFSLSQSAGPIHSAFVSATSTSKKMSYGDSPNHSSTTTYSVPSNSKTGSHRSGNVTEDVLQSFVADTEPEQQLAYKDLKQIKKLNLEEMDLKWQMAMLSKAERKIDFNKKESARFNKQKVRCYKCQQRGHFARECRAKGGNDKQRYSSFKIKEIGKKEEDSKALITVDTLVDWANHDSESDGVIAAEEFGMIAGCDSENTIKESAAKLYNLITGANSEEANTADYTSLSNHTDLDESQMSYGTKSSTSCDPKCVPNDFVSCNDSDKSLDESQMSYGTKSSTSCDPKCVPNDFVSCNDSDKSSEVNITNLVSSDSSLKSSEQKPTDSSCASTSSVSTSVNEAEIESNVETPIKEPISVQDLPSFTCNSSYKNEHASRTSCTKNGSFNNKAGHFRKYASSVSKLCFVCGSGTHLIKDCDFYEKQMTNTTVGIGVGPDVRPQPVPTGKPKVKPVPTGKPKVKPVPTGKPKVTPVSTGKPKVTPVSTGKPKVKPIPTGKPKVTPVSTGKPHVSTPVPTGRPNRPFPVSTDRGFLHHPQQVVLGNHIKKETSFLATEDDGIFNSGCSRSMTGNKERLDDFHAFHGGKVTFGGGEGTIIRKGTIRTPTLDFENVYYIKELQQFNLFFISQICDKKNHVLFTNTECLVLSKDFKLPDDSMVVLKVPRKHNLYTINLNDLCPRANLACLVAHASFDESVKWHSADCQHGIMGLVNHTWEGSRGTWGCEGMDLVRMGCRELPGDEGATVCGIGREFQLGLL